MSTKRKSSATADSAVKRSATGNKPIPRPPGMETKDDVIMNMTRTDIDEWMKTLSDHDMKRIVNLIFNNKTGVSRKKSDDAAISYLVKQPVEEVDSIIENIGKIAPRVGPSSIAKDAVSLKMCVQGASEQAHTTVGGGTVDHFRRAGGFVAMFIVEVAKAMLSNTSGAVVEKHDCHDNKPDWGGRLSKGVGFAWNNMADPVMKRILAVKSFQELRNMAPPAAAAVSVSDENATGAVQTAASDNNEDEGATSPVADLGRRVATSGSDDE